MAKGDELQKVGRAVAARRGHLGMTQQGLADAAGVDIKTIYNLESGARWPRARTRAAISAALGWGGDGLTAIADGGTPAESGDEPIRSDFPLPPPTEKMARVLAPFLADVEIGIKEAQDAHPGQRLTGEWVYPDNPEGAAYWDALADAGFAPEHIPGSVATMLAMSADRAKADRQGGSAAGLSRHPAPVLQALP